MSSYWIGVLTPFAIVLGILLLWLTLNLVGAAVSWAWKQAHYGLLKKVSLPIGYDETTKRPSVRPHAERLADALTRAGEYRMFPLFGWVVFIVRDHKLMGKETKDE